MDTAATGEESEMFFQSLPKAENQDFEFKGFETPIPELGDKIWKAASAFWNSGGGSLVIGVSKDGEAEAGIPLLQGRQSRRDWIDQMIAKVHPSGEYDVQIKRANSETGVFVVKFALSNIAPHMAPDNRYYIRAGAHTVSANHFIVESIRARRATSHPNLRAILRRPPETPAKVLLYLICLGDVPAIDVTVDLINPERLLLHYQQFRDCFPLSISAIDKHHPFAMDYDHLPYSDQWQIGDAAPRLKVKYKDLVGNEFTETFALEVRNSVGSLQIGEPPLEKIAQAIDAVNVRIEHLSSAIRSSRNAR